MGREYLSIKLCVVFAACFGVIACDSVVKPKEKLGPDFGNAVRHNMAVQIVNPKASADINDAPTLDGNRANSAVDVYQTGKTKAVEKVKTTSVGQ